MTTSHDTTVHGSSDSDLLHVVGSDRRENYRDGNLWKTLDAVKKSVFYIACVYMLFFLFSSQHASADDFCDRVLLATDPLAPSYIYSEYTGVLSCSSGTTSDASLCGVPSNTIASRASRREQSGCTDCCHVAIKLNVTDCATVGKAEDPVTGFCIDEADPCTGAGNDDENETQLLGVNPGLCNLGNTFQDVQNVCTLSETAAAYCDTTVTQDFSLDSLLPVQVAYTYQVQYGTSECDPPSSVQPIVFPECEAPPPTCPVGTYASFDDQNNLWSCLTNPENPTDQEDVPDNQTATRETTTTETTTTTNNPDGSVTTETVTNTVVGDCPPGEDCTQRADYEGPGELEAKTFGESLEAFWDAIQDQPFVSNSAGLGDTVPESSSCPTFEIGPIPLIDSTLTMDSHCEILQPLEGSIRTIFLITFSILGILIIMGA